MTTAPTHLGIDLLSGEFYGREPHDAYAWMRANAPVYYDEANDLWAAASYAAVKQASVDTDAFSNAGGIRPKYPPLPMMIDFDAPEHVRRRRLVSEGSRPGASGRWRTGSAWSATPSSTGFASGAVVTSWTSSPPRSRSS